MGIACEQASQAERGEKEKRAERGRRFLLRGLRSTRFAS